MATSRVGMVVSYVVFDVIGSVVRFPLWWYSAGALGVARWLGQGLGYRWRGYAIGLWTRSFFVPMYGATDWAGRLVSMVMRFVVIVARLFAFAIEAMISGLIVLVWLAAPLIFTFFFLDSFSRLPAPL